MRKAEDGSWTLITLWGSEAPKRHSSFFSLTFHTHMLRCRCKLRLFWWLYSPYPLSPHLGLGAQWLGNPWYSWEQSKTPDVERAPWGWYLPPSHAGPSRVDDGLRCLFPSEDCLHSWWAGVRVTTALAVAIKPGGKGGGPLPILSSGRFPESVSAWFGLGSTGGTFPLAILFLAQVPIF